MDLCFILWHKLSQWVSFLRPRPDSHCSETGIVRHFSGSRYCLASANLAVTALPINDSVKVRVFLRCCPNGTLTSFLRDVSQLSARDESSTRVEVCMRIQVARAIPGPASFKTDQENEIEHLYLVQEADQCWK